MTTRRTAQAASFFFAALVTVATLGGIDRLAARDLQPALDASAPAVQQVVITAKRLPARA